MIKRGFDLETELMEEERYRKEIKDIEEKEAREEQDGKLSQM